MRVRIIFRTMAVASFVLISAAMGMAEKTSMQETWQCDAKQECKDTAADCQALQSRFSIRISGVPETLRMTTPERGPIALPSASVSDAARVFAVTNDEVAYKISLQPDGTFVGTLAETMFWGGVITHILTANCRRDLA